MALPNNPTQLEVVKAIKDLENSDNIEVITTSSTGDNIASLLANKKLPVLHTTSTSLDAYLPFVSDDNYYYNFGGIVADRWYSQRYSKTLNSWESIITKSVPTKTSDLTNDSGYITSVLGAYPVGAIYMSISTTSPASLIGGTWQQLSDFQIPVGTSGTALPVRTGGRHSGTSYALNFDYISGSTSIQCNEQSKNYAVASNGVGLTISQLDGSSWGSNWGGWGTIIPNNLYANIDSDRLLTVHAWKRTA